MKYYAVRLSPEAQTDIVRIHARIVDKSGSTITADRYIDRISGFLSSLNVFPSAGPCARKCAPGYVSSDLNAVPAWRLSWRRMTWWFYVFSPKAKSLAK